MPKVLKIGEEDTLLLQVLGKSPTGYTLLAAPIGLCESSKSAVLTLSTVPSKCKKKGGKDLGKFFRGMIKDMGLKGQVEIVKTECTDRCDYAPVVCM